MRASTCGRKTRAAVSAVRSPCCRHKGARIARIWRQSITFTRAMTFAGISRRAARVIASFAVDAITVAAAVKRALFQNRSAKSAAPSPCAPPASLETQVNPDWVDAPGRFYILELGCFDCLNIGPAPINSPPMQINVSWPALPASDQVTSYDLRITHNGTVLPLVQVPPGPSPSYQIVDPAPGTYAFAVRANNIVGNGSYGPSTNITSVPSTPPAPTVVVVP